MRRICLLLCVAVTSCTVGPPSALRTDTSARDPRAAQRCEARWSAPQDLLSFDGRPTYVETPTLAATDTALLLVGTPSFFWATRDAFDPSPGPTRADTAEYLDRLQRNHWYVGMSLDARLRASGVRFPDRLGGILERAVVARDSAGGIHLYYVTHPEDSVALWHARRDGGRWTTPERLLTESRLSWQWADVRARREMHVAVAFFRAGTGTRAGGGIAYLRQRDGDRRSVTYFHRGMPYYASVLPYGSDSLLIAFDGFEAADRAGNGRHLYLIRASVRDSTFPPARRVHFSGPRLANWPRLFRDSSSVNGLRLGVLWVSAGPRGGAADSLHAITSRDGVTWSPPVSAQLPVPARYLSVVSSPELGAHGVTHSNRDGDPAVHFHWHDGAWQRVEVLPFEGIANSPSLMRVRADSLLLMWGVERRYAGAPPEAPGAPVSRYAWLTTSCGLPAPP